MAWRRRSYRFRPGWRAPPPSIEGSTLLTGLLIAAGVLAVIFAILTVRLGIRTQRLARELDRVSRHAAQQTADLRRPRPDETIMERLPDPLLVLDADRTICHANQAARSTFGSDVHAVLRHPGLRGAIERAFGSGTVHRADVSLPVPVPRELEATVVPLDPPLADGGRALVLLSDRTRERAVERMRADFVANASHELRTPLASLIGFIETLRGPAADDPPAQRRFLGIMDEQAARMNRLIDDLLSLSRVELSEHQAPVDQVDLARVVSQVAASFEPRLSEGARQLDLRLTPGVPTVTGDADQLAQVIQNLVDNAVKYGAENDTIRIGVAPSPETGRWPSRPGVLLSVTDQGPGIPRVHLPRLTERFYRVDKGRSRAVGGTGLGLAIVRHIVNRHRGQLLIESEEGVGTTVTIWLPQARQAAEPVTA